MPTRRRRTGRSASLERRAARTRHLERAQEGLLADVDELVPRAARGFGAPFGTTRLSDWITSTVSAFSTCVAMRLVQPLSS